MICTYESIDQPKSCTGGVDELSTAGHQIHRLANVKIIFYCTSLIFFSPVINKMVHNCSFSSLYITFNMGKNFPKASKVGLDNQV